MQVLPQSKVVKQFLESSGYSQLHELFQLMKDFTETLLSNNKGNLLL